MIGAYVILAGMVLFAGAITLLDWLARRKERRSRGRPASADQ